MKYLELMMMAKNMTTKAVQFGDIQRPFRLSRLNKMIYSALLEVRKDAYRECAEIAKKYGEETCNIYEPQDIRNLILAKMEELK